MEVVKRLKIAECRGKGRELVKNTEKVTRMYSRQGGKIIQTSMSTIIEEMQFLQCVLWLVLYTVEFIPICSFAECLLAKYLIKKWNNIDKKIVE